MNNDLEVSPVEDIFKVSEEEQGELCFKGRNIMSGYWGNPNDEDNLEIINKKNKGKSSRWLASQWRQRLCR